MAQVTNLCQRAWFAKHFYSFADSFNSFVGHFYLFVKPSDWFARHFISFAKPFDSFVGHFILFAKPFNSFARISDLNKTSFAARYESINGLFY